MNAGTPAVLRTLALAGVAALVALWAGAYLTWPMAFDHGLLAWAGDVIRAGGMPYRDAWDMKGPLALYTFAGIQSLFGRNMWGVRAFDLLVLAVGAWALFQGAGRLVSGRVALWTTLAFLLWYGSQGYQNTAQPDGWVAVLLTLGFVPLLARAEERPAGLRVLGGVLIGCATLVKPLYGVFLLVPALDALAARALPRSRLLAAAGWTAAGFLLPLAATAAWLAAHGALGALIEVDLFYASRVYTPLVQVGLQHRLDGLARLLLRNPPVPLALAGAAAGAQALWGTDRRSTGVLLAWLLLAVFDVVLAGQFYGYHWLPVYPPLSLLAAAGFGSLLPDPARGGVPTQPGSSGQTSRAFAVAAGVLLVLLAANEPARSVARWAAVATGRRSAAEYIGDFNDLGPVRPVYSLRAADYIRSRTQAADAVGIWGSNSLILYLAGRRSPSRFGWNLPLVLGEGSATRAGYRTDYLAALEREAPIYFVVSRWGENDVMAHPALFPELREFLESRYRLETTVGDLDLYRRTDGSAPAN